ncbi:MAG: response regulator transcription factor [Austwickia sp.]|nr:response regulator transcription factor [Austwickia sp.]MCO5310251.1 response regulator transcription factor [Austwickia sp.]
MIRVLLVDDQQLVRTGIRLIVDLEPDLEVCGEAADGAEAMSAVARWHPDVVLMDVRMPVLDGLEATRRLSAAGSSAKVLVLTTFDLDGYVYDALRAGASGFPLKDVPRDQLVSAIRVVAGGESLLSPTVTKRLIERFVRLPPPSTGVPPILAGLSDRELEVLRLIALGQGNAEIAHALLIGEATVKTYVSRLFTKLELRDRVQAVVLAYESGLVQPGSARAVDRPT